MKIEKNDEKDRAMREIENSLQDIENFAEGNYKEMIRKNNVSLDRLRELSERAGVSKLTASEFLKAAEETEEDS